MNLKYYECRQPLSLLASFSYLSLPATPSSPPPPSLSCLVFSPPIFSPPLSCTFSLPSSHLYPIKIWLPVQRGYQDSGWPLHTSTWLGGQRTGRVPARAEVVDCGEVPRCAIGHPSSAWTASLAAGWGHSSNASTSLACSSVSRCLSAPNPFE